MASAEHFAVAYVQPSAQSRASAVLALLQRFDFFGKKDQKSIDNPRGASDNGLCRGFQRSGKMNCIFVHVEVMVNGKRKYTYTLPQYRPDVPGATKEEKRHNAERMALTQAQTYWFRAPKWAAKREQTQFVIGS